MEKEIKLVSNSLVSLNHNLQNLILNEKIKEFTPVIVEADGKFTSIIKTDDNFNPNSLDSNISTEDENEETKENKQQLLNKATDALKQTLENSKELNDILNKIKKLSSENNNNTWKVNKQGNTASLNNKNAYIFKQNNNLCLSHNGKIELFHSVEELRKWLKDNNYPLPGCDIVIHESKNEIKEENKSLRNWYDLYLQKKSDLKAEYLKSHPINQEKDVETKNECFGVTTVSNLGSAVSMLANSKKKESIEESAYFIPGHEYSQWGKAANYHLFNPSTLEKIKNGEIELPSNVEDLFYGSQIAKMDYDLKAKTSNDWNVCTSYGLSKEAENLLNNPNNLSKEFLVDLKSILNDEKIKNLDENEKKNIIHKFAISYIKNNPNETNLQNISDILNDFVIYYKATGKKITNLLQKNISKDQYDGIIKPVVEKYLSEHPEDYENLIKLQPNDSINYDKLDNDNLDLNKKFTLSKGEKNTENRLKWQKLLYSSYSETKNVINKLYDAIFGSDSKAKISNIPNTALHDYVNKKLDKTNLVMELTPDDIQNLKNKKSNQKDKKDLEKNNEKNNPFNKEEIDLLQSKNININDYEEDDLKQILSVLKKIKQKNESTKLNILESAEKYPWIKKVLNTRLVEDDTPADFATGSPISSDMSNDSLDSSNSNETNTQNDIPVVDFENETDGQSGNEFGNVDISLNGTSYDPEQNEEQNISPNLPEYKIVDVLINDEDSKDIKVKVQNTDTKKYEIKNLDEIDV